MRAQHKLRSKAPNAHTCQLKRRRVCDRISAGKRAGRHMAVCRDGDGTCATRTWRLDRNNSNNKSSKIRKFKMHCVTVRPWAANRTPANDPLCISKSPLHLFTNIKGASTMSAFAALRPGEMMTVLRAFKCSAGGGGEDASGNQLSAFLFNSFFLLFLCAESWKTPLKEK